MSDELKPIVVKVSGSELDDDTFLAEFAAVIRDLKRPAVIVHGGGREISNLQRQLGIEPRYVDGIRVTDEPSLAVVEMVLCGVVNKRLVRLLLSAGVDAVGLSGVDRGLVRAKQMSSEMGFTGEVTSVRGEVLVELLEKGVTPVVSPVSLGDDSNYNVNADHVAGAIATAIQAQRIVFLTNVEGVLMDDKVVPTLTIGRAEALISGKHIFGGMIPKVRTALHAVDEGVPEAVITNLTGLKSGGGTVFTHVDIGSDEA
jgi:acetylglutamate kinase